MAHENVIHLDFPQETVEPNPLAFIRLGELQFIVVYPVNAYAYDILSNSHPREADRREQ